MQICSRFCVFLKHFTLMFIVSSCQSLLPLFTSIEDIADDTAIKCEISKEAIDDKKDIDVTINVKNIK